MSDGSDIQFAIKGWSAWTDHESFDNRWLDLLSLPECRSSARIADVAFIAPGARRRFKPMARAVVYTAMQAIGHADWAEVPLVLFSEHGETHRGLRIMTDIANSEPVSPAEFSHSVHNAIAGQLSILTGNTNPVIAVANSGEGLGGALLEASLLLRTSDYTQVMVVCYDEPLPEFYAAYADSPCAVLAVAVLLAKGKSEWLLSGARHCVSDRKGESAWRQMIRLAYCLETGGSAFIENATNRWDLTVSTHVSTNEG